MCRKVHEPVTNEEIKEAIENLYKLQHKAHEKREENALLLGSLVTKVDAFNERLNGHMDDEEGKIDKIFNLIKALLIGCVLGLFSLVGFLIVNADNLHIFKTDADRQLVESVGKMENRIDKLESGLAEIWGHHGDDRRKRKPEQPPILAPGNHLNRNDNRERGSD